MPSPSSPSINSLNVSQMGRIAPTVQYIWDSTANIFRALGTSDLGGSGGGSSGSVSAFPSASSVTAVSLTTSATGANFVTFASTACKGLDVVNTTGTDLEYQRNGTGSSYIRIAAGATRYIIGITDASQIGIRRFDQSNTQVTLSAEAVVPATSSSLPVASSVSIVAITTSATGATYVAFGSNTCSALEIINTSAADIEYQRGGSGTSVKIVAGSSRFIVGITNSSQIAIRRVDNSNTTITLSAEVYVP